MFFCFVFHRNEVLQYIKQRQWALRHNMYAAGLTRRSYNLTQRRPKVRIQSTVEDKVGGGCEHLQRVDSRHVAMVTQLVAGAVAADDVGVHKRFEAVTTDKRHRHGPSKNVDLGAV